jgi:hypothetical protein
MHTDQLTGVTYYLPTLLQTFLGTGHRETLWIAGLSSVDSTVFVLIAALIVDKVGRKPLLFYGSIFQVRPKQQIVGLRMADEPKGLYFRDHRVSTRNCASWQSIFWHCSGGDAVYILRWQFSVLAGNIMGIVSCLEFRFWHSANIGAVLPRSCRCKFERRAWP